MGFLRYRPGPPWQASRARAQNSHYYRGSLLEQECTQKSEKLLKKLAEVPRTERNVRASNQQTAMVVLQKLVKPRENYEVFHSMTHLRPSSIQERIGAGYSVLTGYPSAQSYSSERRDSLSAANMPSLKLRL